MIYDVSGSNFYKKGAAYDLFAGHDASVNLATMKIEEPYLNKWGKEELTQEQKDTLEDWVKNFEVKYRKVGKVIDS